ncbi:MAG TPA: hypothetical protein VEV81_00160, partial [Pyrinomonadaceae bacterium]|nr:hypothetical protein [Pyrinomonadaceae bacterium]
MDARFIFLNSAGRLRSGWRFVISGLLLYLSIKLTFQLVVSILYVSLGPSALLYLDGRPGFVIQGFCLLAPATLTGWACGKFFEDLPMRALGWAFHRGWLRHLFYGSLIGAASLLLATALATIPGGLKFTLNAPVMFATI